MKDNSMDLENFFNDLHEKTWKDHIEYDASSEFKKFMEYIENNRDLIIDDTVESIKKMQALKLEGQEEFTFSTYKKWLTKFTANYIIEKLEDNCE